MKIKDTGMSLSKEMFQDRHKNDKLIQLLGGCRRLDFITYYARTKSNIEVVLHAHHVIMFPYKVHLVVHIEWLGFHSSHQVTLHQLQTQFSPPYHFGSTLDIHVKANCVPY